MKDRLAQLLIAHIELLERHLEWLSQGARFKIPEDVVDLVPRKEGDIVARMERLRQALDQHRRDMDPEGANDT